LVGDLSSGADAAVSELRGVGCGDRDLSGRALAEPPAPLQHLAPLLEPRQAAGTTGMMMMIMIMMMMMMMMTPLRGRR
jgi:hypothetical protein